MTSPRRHGGLTAAGSLVRGTGAPFRPAARARLAGAPTISARERPSIASHSSASSHTKLLSASPRRSHGAFCPMPGSATPNCARRHNKICTGLAEIAGQVQGLQASNMDFQSKGWAK